MTEKQISKAISTLKKLKEVSAIIYHEDGDVSIQIAYNSKKELTSKSHDLLSEMILDFAFTQTEISYGKFHLFLCIDSDGLNYELDKIPEMVA